jgi:hypothetical protein
MRILIVGIMAAAFIGCQSTQLSWHIERDVIKNTRVDRFPGFLTAPYTKALHQECPLSARKNALLVSGTSETDLDFSQCKTMGRQIDGVVHDHWDQAFEPGTLNGLGGSLVQTGAILGGAAILSNGLKHQGSGRLNTGTNNSYNSTYNGNNLTNCYSRDCF